MLCHGLSGVRNCAGFETEIFVSLTDDRFRFSDAGGALAKLT